MMKAVVYYAPGDIRVEDRPEPEPAEDNLIVEVRCCAICGTDLKLATIGNPRCHPPRIIGHELVGYIVHVGSQVQGFATGERITLATTMACGDCPYCDLGLGNLCPNAKPISYDFDGGFAERLAIPPLAIVNGNVIKVPDSVSDEAAALSEPLSCVLNALELANVKACGSVLIIGGGPLGALHAEAAKALGVKKVMIVQRSEPRLSLLRKLGGVRVINGAQEDVLSVVREQTGGLGADLVSVCAPTREAQEKSIHFARKGGTVSLFASLPKDAPDITLNSRVVHYGELRIVGASDSRPEHVAKAVRLMAEGKMDTTPIITHRISLEDIHEGLDLMKNKQSLKVLVYPHKSRKS
ncbi:MAG: alcohol dehydrogenase catalytic domain-containing protein [Chloroflexi bacterium]|nr:alcohol dehydrogenase catalytic domain-containing protein [Chloroflexota bacterium]